jgi:hypothetical protein
MLKTLILALSLFAYSVPTQAVRLHFFSGYSRPEGVTSAGARIPLTNLGILGGFGGSIQPWKFFGAEASIFGVFPPYKQRFTQSSEEITYLTGLFDLMGKILIPLPKQYQKVQMYGKGGLWGLHTMKRTVDLLNNHAEPRRDPKGYIRGYGVAAGGGVTFHAFWSRLHIDLSGTCYFPGRLPDNLSAYFPENRIQQRFFNAKIGIIIQ